MDPAAPRPESSTDQDGRPLRRSFHDELDQLRLQVEVMGAKVDQNLERMICVLQTGDADAAEDALASDDAIDAMNVSLTERCYDLLARENPVASELRFLVSVLRMLSELERIGDLALRVVKLNPERPLWAGHEETYELLVAMGDLSVSAYRDAMQAWSAQDPSDRLAIELVDAVRSMDRHDERLMDEILQLDGPTAVRVATTTLIAGRSLGRIADHSAIIGARLRYLLTGDPEHLNEEVR